MINQQCQKMCSFLLNWCHRFDCKMPFHLHIEKFYEESRTLFVRSFRKRSLSLVCIASHQFNKSVSCFNWIYSFFHSRIVRLMWRMHIILSMWKFCTVKHAQRKFQAYETPWNLLSFAKVTTNGNLSVRKPNAREKKPNEKKLSIDKMREWKIHSCWFRM